jgi:hypothetical protein
MMEAQQVFWHLANFVLPALALGALAAALAKLFWRGELAAVSWTKLARDAALASLAVLVAGLLWFGRDGAMATYLGMVAACALTLWWRGFLLKR